MTVGSCNMTGIEDTRRRSRSQLVTWIAILAIFAVAIIQRWGSLITHDVSWSLYLAQRMAEGERIYVDLIEINPPLIFWLLSPVVWFSKVVGVSITAGLKAIVFTSAAVSTILCAGLIRKINFAASSFALVAIAYVLTILPGSDFGQREHLLVIFSLPYLLLVVARREGVEINMAMIASVSLLAAIGICLKPYFVLMPILLESYLLLTLGWRRALFRPEQVIMVILGIAYAASIFIFTPQYLSRILVYGVEVYASGFGVGYLKTLLLAPLSAIGAVLAFYWLYVRPNQSADAIVIVLTLASIALFIAYMVQAMGWNYHSFPVLAMVVVLGTVLFARTFTNFQNDPKRQLIPVMILAPFFFFILSPAINYSYPRNIASHLQTVVKKYTGTKSLVILTSDLWVGFPFVTESDQVWASRFPSLWLTPGLVKRRLQIGGTTPLLDEIEAYNRRAVAEDIIRYKPQLVIVDETEIKINFGNNKFDYIADFSNDKLFRAEWKKYKKMETISNFAIYQRLTVKTQT